MFYKNDAELTAALKFWQSLLKLDAWQIKAQICRQQDMPGDAAQGNSTYVFSKRQAIISLLDPLDFPRNTLFGQDMEQTLVHELLHLSFAGFTPEDDDSLEYALMEQTIDSLATLLVMLVRATNN